MNLPPLLAYYIQQTVEEFSAKELALAAENLSQRYRAATDEKTAHASGKKDVLAYVATRLPATYAALKAVMDELIRLVPDFMPSTLLDVGAGPGTAAWAAIENWPHLQHISLIERERSFQEWGKTAMANSSHPALLNSRWYQHDVGHPQNVATAAVAQQLPNNHDLVTASFLLGELSPATRQQLIEQLWQQLCQQAQGYIIIVEPGTTSGYQRILAAREQLLTLGGHVIAPCPHHLACPLPEGQWCHFSQRLNRSAVHRRLKNATLSHEDEKFSYLIISRIPPVALSPYARVLHQPKVDKIAVSMVLCTKDGQQQKNFARRNNTLYQQAKKYDWGDSIPD
ncbi:MAG: small ribosomal subunit Rsm22 family protein [Alphaproteobacteria bacterium]